jgi:hypothetical protein
MPNEEEEIQKDIAKREVKKVHGQPTNQNIDLLEDDLWVASSYYSESGGGAHGHASLLLSAVD